MAGVWFEEWSAAQAFLVYCLESVIAGLYNIVMMLMTTLVKKKDVWENGGNEFMVSGYGFIAFFTVHYGFFVFVQMSIFLGVTEYKDTAGVFDFVFHITRYIPVRVQWLLLLFIISNGLIVVKNFVLTGDYKTASLGTLMFAPYARVFVQQFCVILGSFFLTFGWGKIFIVIFVAVKIFFETVLDYEKILKQKAPLKKTGS